MASQFKVKKNRSRIHDHSHICCAVVTFFNPLQTPTELTKIRVFWFRSHPVNLPHLIPKRGISISIYIYIPWILTFPKVSITKLDQQMATRPATISGGVRWVRPGGLPHFRWAPQFRFEKMVLVHPKLIRVFEFRVITTTSLNQVCGFEMV